MSRRKPPPASLSELVEDRWNLHIICRCGRIENKPARPLLAMFQARGWADDFATLSAHLRCIKCGERPQKLDGVRGWG
ncbi:MAG TPA: hypothetical protein VF592_03730 [Sphingomonas sp.]|jgi:hypothetical protein|uniref:hypothetical protein n=1 Tax=Sphingomonas sp. TaxID=28214 RepID=UPI002EDAB583